MTTEGPAEILARYTSEFGEDLGVALYAFESRLFELHRRWRDYDTLYCTDVCVDVLNKFAPNFFHRHQQMTFECVVMAIARLTDPVRTGSFKNLSVKYLMSLLELNAKAEVQQYADLALSKSYFAREWRNKRFSHHDLKDSVKLTVPLDDVTHAHIDEAIVSINRFVEQVFLKCGGYTMCNFDVSYRSNDLGGANVLLSRLHEANRAREKKSERMKVGDIRPEDWMDEDDPVLKELRGCRK